MTLPLKRNLSDKRMPLMHAHEKGTKRGEKTKKRMMHFVHNVYKKRGMRCGYHKFAPVGLGYIIFGGGVFFFDKLLD